MIPDEVAIIHAALVEYAYKHQDDLPELAALARRVLDSLRDPTVSQHVADALPIRGRES